MVHWIRTTVNIWLICSCICRCLLVPLHQVLFDSSSFCVRLLFRASRGLNCREHFLASSLWHQWYIIGPVFLTKNIFVKSFVVFDFLLLFAWAMDYDSWTVDHSHVRPMDHGHRHGHDNVLWTMAMAMVHGPWPWTLCMNQGPWAWSMAIAWSIAMAMVHGPWPLSWPSVAHGPCPWPWSMVHGHYHGRLWPIDHGHGHGPWSCTISLIKIVLGRVLFCISGKAGVVDMSHLPNIILMFFGDLQCL